MEAGAARARRAAVLMAAAVHLPRQIVAISFADARHGSVSTLTYGRSTDVVAYVTSDGGATWRRDAALDYLGEGMVVRRAEGASGTEQISADGGRTWRVLVEPDVRAAQSSPPVFVDPLHGWWLVMVPAATPAAGIWRTDDGGATWHRSGSGIPSSGYPYQLRFLDPLRGVLAFEQPGGARSLYVTGDGGVTWSLALSPTSPRADRSVLGVALDLHGGTLLAWLTTVAGTQDRNGTIGTYVLASGDGGRTWSAPRPGPILDQFSAGPALDDRGRFVLLDDRRLWTSDDDGSTWTARVIQAPAGLLPLGPVPAGSALLAPALGPPSGTLRPLDTLLRSTDGGVHWERMRLP